MCVPVNLLTKVCSNTAVIGRMFERKSLNSARCSLGEHAGLAGCLIGIVREEIPAAKGHVLQTRERHQLLDEGRSVSVPLSQPHSPICVSEPIGLETPRRMASTPAIKVVATAPNSGHHDAQLSGGGLDFDRGPDLVSGM